MLKCRKPTSGRWSGRATPRSLASRAWSGHKSRRLVGTMPLPGRAARRVSAAHRISPEFVCRTHFFFAARRLLLPSRLCSGALLVWFGWPRCLIQRRPRHSRLRGSPPQPVPCTSPLQTLSRGASRIAMLPMKRSVFRADSAEHLRVQKAKVEERKLKSESWKAKVEQRKLKSEC